MATSSNSVTSSTPILQELYAIATITGLSMGGSVPHMRMTLAEAAK
jgi:hypothetical protein